jgi:hypothetical protein
MAALLVCPGGAGTALSVASIVQINSVSLMTATFRHSPIWPFVLLWASSALWPP